MENQKDLAIVILVGGKSKRFGYEKTKLKLNGKPIILHQIETLAEFDQDIFLVANSEEQVIRFKKDITFPKEVHFIIDERELLAFKEIYSPIIGIFSAFKKLKKESFKKAFILSGDTPLINADLIKYIIHNSINYDCTIPKWDSGYLESLFAIYPVNEAFHQAKKIMEEQEHYGLNKLIDENWKLNYISVEHELKPLDPNLLSLININAPIDIEKIKTIYKR